MVSYNVANIGLDNGLLSDSIKLLHDPMLIFLLLIQTRRNKIAWDSIRKTNAKLDEFSSGFGGLKGLVDETLLIWIYL